MKPMGPLKMDGNLAENWRKWKQRWSLYARSVEPRRKTRGLSVRFSCIQSERKHWKSMILSPLPRRNKIKSSRSFRNLRATVHQEKTRRTNDMYLIRVYKTEEHSMHFLLDLCNKAKTCEFGTLQDSLIKDRIVCGIDDKSIRERLLRDSDLTLEKAIDIVKVGLHVRLFSRASNATD